MTTDSDLIDNWLEEIDDWRGDTFKKVRKLIMQADPEIVEELKWKKPSNPLGAPVYSHNGIVIVANILKNSVRLTFVKGAILDDPSGLFNGGLDSNSRRWVDFGEGDTINETALKGLIRSAASLNLSSKLRPAT